jgi:hypothetical protein
MVPTTTNRTVSKTELLKNKQVVYRCRQTQYTYLVFPYFNGDMFSPSEHHLAPGAVWTIAENPTPEIRSSDRRASSESLYRLSYPGPVSVFGVQISVQPHSYTHYLYTCIFHTMYFKLNIILKLILPFFVLQS